MIPDGAIETPLGTVGIDEELASALAEADPNVRAARAPHELEHSLKVQLPFLQRFLPSVPVAPVLMGYQTPATIAAAARALQQVIAESRRTVAHDCELRPVALRIARPRRVGWMGWSYVASSISTFLVSSNCY